MPKGYDMIPWLSSGTYGECDASVLFDATAHAFCNGATGIAFFQEADIDDMADLLMVSKAIGCISPYEEIVLDGDLAFDNITGASNCVVSAMGLNGNYLLAVSPVDASKPVSFSVNGFIQTGPYVLKDLRWGGTYSYSSGNITFTGMLKAGTVFLLESVTNPVPETGTPLLLISVVVFVWLAISFTQPEGRKGRKK